MFEKLVTRLVEELVGMGIEAVCLGVGVGNSGNASGNTVFIFFGAGVGVVAKVA